MRIDAKGIYYRQLNELIHQAVRQGEQNIVLDRVNGQRYIGTGLSEPVKITVNGVPGNDLAAFMDGPAIVVNANGQDGIGNTMNAGKVIIHGDVGDIAGHSMRGGKLYIKGNAGYRIGIHMKSFQNFYPVIVIGGCVGNFLGEYMAGGLIIVLGLAANKNQPVVGDYLGTGMHGGTIYVRGKVEDYQLGREIKKAKFSQEDKDRIAVYLREFCRDFKFKQISLDKFTKLIPCTTRPYGKLYAY